MVKKAGSILLSVLLWGVILVAALYTMVTLATRDEANVSSIAGFSPLVVKTDSMSPTFNADDLILIHTTDPAALRDKLLHTLACKAAIKGGRHTDEREREALVRRVLGDPSLKYCPHGRPIVAVLTAAQLERSFGRA